MSVDGNVNESGIVSGENLLLKYFTALRSRLWLRRAFVAACTAISGVAALIALARLSISLGFSRAGDAFLLAAGIVAVGGIIAIVRTRPTPVAAAKEADRNLGLRERLATAAEIIQPDSKLPRELAARQLSDAAEIAARNPARRAFPIVNRRLFGIATLATVFAIVLSLWLPDLSAQLGSAFALKPGLAAESPQVGDEQPNDLASNNVDDLVGQIDHLRKRIAEKSIEPGEAARQLAQAEQRLNQKLETSGREQQNLKNLADALRQTSTGQDIAGAIDRGEFSKASDQLNDLARNSDQLSSASKKDLAQALDKAAGNTDQNAGLKDAERRASQSLNRGDYKDVERSFRNLGDELTKSGKDVVPQSELGKAAGKLDQAKQDLGLSDSSEGAEGDQGANARFGNPAAGGTTPGNSPGGSLPGNAPGSNQQGQGGRDAQPGQNGDKPANSSGNEKSGDLPQQDGSGSRIGVSGKPVEVDSPDSQGQLRPGEGKGEQRGSQVGGARPAAGVGVAQPTDPIDSQNDFTRVSPDRRPAVSSYFSPGGR